MSAHRTTDSARAVGLDALTLGNPRQRKALVLSLLMIMLAQTAYIEAYRGWTLSVDFQGEKNDVLQADSPAVCAATSRTSGTEIHVDVAEGDDTYPGTTNCPKASLGAAVTLAATESASRPEIVLHAGLYHENVSVNNLDNLLIRAAIGERVVFDGTRSITADLGGVWGSADGDGIQEVTLTEDGWQLFLDHEEQVPARWPNAGFDDETVFNRSYWAEGTLNNSNNAYTVGWLTDAGPELGVHAGLNETVNASGLDPVGAIAVMNLGSFRSNSRIITEWNASNGTFAYDGNGVGWKTKHHAYILEGKRELIDQDGEWWFNNTNNRLHYKTPSGQNANDLNLRVKVQPFAISVDGSDGVTIQGIDFFGTTVNFNNCDACSLTNASLEYPSTSKRGLGIAGESEDDRWMTRFYRSTHSFVDNISITNTDGGAIEFHGSGGQSHNNTVNNSYFYAIDWSAADQKGLMTTVYEGGRDMTFSNNTVHLTGASSVLSIGDAPQVLYNEVWDVGYLQTDGAVVQVMQGEAPGAVIAYNWIHDVIKYGARFDAPINQVGTGANGTMHHNVIWNAAGGLMVKGDYHNIHNNTVFNSTGKNDIIFLTDGGMNNKNSTLHYNAVDTMADHRSDDIFANPLPYGSDWMNWNGYIHGKQHAVTTLNGESNGDVGVTCIINSTKSLLCWGYNGMGNLGLGNTTDQLSPVAVSFPNGGTVEKLADSGGYPLHNCAILTNGSLYCWGRNSDGELGIGSTSQRSPTPQFVNLGTGVTAVDVSVGSGFTCAATNAGSLMCWGNNEYGKLGRGSSGSFSSTPQNASLPTNRTAVEVQLGDSHACALLDNGDVACWGYNGFGGLGTGNTATRTSPTVVSLDPQRHVVSMGVGKHHTCITYDNGSIVCAGRDNDGQQGNTSTSANSLMFTYTNQLANLSIIALAAENSSCALLANGTAQCWGYGGHGQIGDGTTANNGYPDDLVNSPPARFIVDLSMSGPHSCLVLDDGSVACWGLNNKGQLGLGNTTNQNQPVVLTGLDDLSTTSVHAMLVDPANEDFRPTWGSRLHVLNAGAYAAADPDPWTAGISWTYSTPNAPIAGCMLQDADNQDANATLPDGSCTFSTTTMLSALDVRLHVDPTNSSSYGGSGSTLQDLSPHGNNGTVSGPTWDPDFTRFDFDGSCSAPSNGVCDEISVANHGTLRPGHLGEDLAVGFGFGASASSYLASSASGSGKDVGALEKAFTVALWVKPTDCANGNNLQVILQKELSFHIGCKSGYWFFGTGSGSQWHNTEWLTTSVPATDDVWQHLAFTRPASGSGTTFHLNGEAVYSVNSYEGDLPGATSQRFTLGASLSSSGSWESSTQFTGWVDDVRIYTADRSSTVAADMHAYPSTSNANLNAFFDFNVERHNDVFTSAANLATASGAAQAGLSLAIGSPVAQRVWSVAVDGTDTVLTFNRSVLTADGGWRVPVGVSEVDALVVGGGGGGGYNTGGGGGGGGVGIYNATSVSASSSMAVVVGHGGRGSTTNGSNGFDGQASQFATSVVGGGGGGAAWKSGGEDGSSAPTGSPAYAQRGSGGGGANGGSGGSGATDGGDGATNAGAGGGGAGVNGSSVSSYQTGADGGAGVSSSITGSSVTYGSGGGGGSWNGAGSGGSGAGNGGRNYAATDGTAHRGGGGGGGGNSNHKPGGGGGSGVVIVRYASVDTDGWTVSTWFNASTLKGSTIVGTFDNGGTTSDYGWAIRMKYNGAVYGVVGTTSNASAAWTGDTLMSANRWYHATLVADTGSTLTLYIDGQQVRQTSLTNSGPLRNVANDIYMGTYNGGEFADAFAGHIGTTTLIAGALSSSGVQALHNATLGPYQNTTAMAYPSVTMTANQAQTFSSGPIDVTNGSLTTEFELVGNLPSGLSFGTSNGTVWGTPMWAQSATNYTVRANNSAGSFTTTFSLTVLPLPPNFVYAGYSNLQFTKGTAIASIYPSNAGGEIEACSVDPALPSGLVLSSSCVLSGTPSAVSSNTTYTVNGSNDGGYGTAQFSIIVNDQIASVSYATPIEIVNNRPLTTVTPTVSGGTPTQWAVSPSLPTGLSFGTANGSVWGEPTGVTTNSTHTVWANNTGGSATTTLVLAINWSMTPSSQTLQLTRNVTLSPALTWTWTYGGAGTAQVTGASCAIVPTLPAGLTLNQGNCSITGTPTTPASSSAYTLWANRSSSSYSGQIQLGVGLNAPSLTYPASTYVLANNTPFTPIQPVNTGGEVTSWWISGSPLGGFFFGYSNGTIWGSPNATTDPTTFTIWANNSAGASSTTVTIEVVDPPTGLQYGFANLTLTKGTLMSTVNPVVTGGSPSSWTISPGLPTGLSFSTVTGAIGGTPSVLQTTTVQHTIWGNNTAGSVSFTFNLTVNDVQPANLTYANTNLTLTVGTPVNIAPPSMEGGPVTSWSIDPSLPAGLTFSTSTGRINGTPTALSVTAVTYTVTATNSGGSGFTTFSMGVLATPPSSLSYSPSNIVLTIGQTMTPNVPSVSGGTITEWWISGEGIVGLNFELSNGTIWGTPIELTDGTQTYMVWANNSGGSTATNITVTVVDEVPGPFEYIPEDTEATNNSYVHIGPSFINITTGNGSTWLINDINSGVWNADPGDSMSMLVGDTIYFDADDGSTGKELWAHSTSNGTTWQVADIFSNGSSSRPGYYLGPFLLGDALYFSAQSTDGVELWAHDTSNGTTWQVTDINNGSGHGNPGRYMQTEILVGDTLYFDAWDGSTGYELWAHNASNQTTWQVADINSGSGSSWSGKRINILVGDTIYFDADNGTTGQELWAHNTSNGTTWQVADLRQYGTGNSNPGEFMSMLVGDTVYFDAEFGIGQRELWAHSTSNETTWRVTYLASGSYGDAYPGQSMSRLVGDTLYFSASVNGAELHAHNTSNGTTWMVADINTNPSYSASIPGYYMGSILVGDVLYFDATDGITGQELWAHDTSNRSTWQVADIYNGANGSQPQKAILVGDTLYFIARDGSTGYEGWAYDTSNQSAWQVGDFNTGSSNGYPGLRIVYLVGDTLYFDVNDGNSGRELYAYRPSSINRQTNTGGMVTSWAINGTLPNGVAFGTNNGTLYGTPTELWPQTSYTVWANNSGGSSVAYLNFTVVDDLPTITYPADAVVLTVNSSNTGALPMAPTVSGDGAVVSWAIEPALPAGLSFGTSNGTVWGTPTVLQTTAVTYTVWANNTGGSTNVSFTLSVVDQVPTSVAYTPSGQWVWVNGTLTTMLATVNGPGTITEWRISPTFLPPGVVFNSSTGTVSGTPSEVWANTTYTVEASNSGGSVSTTFWLHVRQQAPSITYNVTNVTLVSNVSSVVYGGTNTGGPIDGGHASIHGYSDVFCAIDAAGQVWCWGENEAKIVNRTAATSTNLEPTLQTLPAGRYATSIGVGYEAACALLDNGSVACWGDAGGSLSGSSILKAYENDGYVNPVLIPGLGGDVVATSLAVGFASACVEVASGVPRCWGSNAWWSLGIGTATGPYSTPVNLTVIPSGRTVMSLSHGNTHACALLDNASVVCWGDNSDGQLGDGTHTARSSPVWPDLWGRAVASVEAGHRTTCVGFVDGGAACWGDNSEGQLGDGTQTDRNVPTNVTGSHADAVFTSFVLPYSASCALLGNGSTVCWGDEAGQSDGAYRTTPTHVVFDNGVRATSLAGDFSTVCAVLSNASVACWGSGDANNFGVLTTVSSSDEPLAGVLGRDARSNPGGWYFNGTLPAGLQFSPLNGTLWGTPREVLSSWFNSTVTVRNSAGTSSSTFSMRVIDSLPTLSYTPSNLSLVRGANASSWSLMPTLVGPGDITSWVIEPALPSGLQFGANNGTLYGASSVLQSRTAYTVWANNSGGSSVAYLNLTVVDQLPVLSYASTNLTLFRDGTNPELPFEATLSGGAATSWAISATLPSGLTFDTTNGSILGNPQVNASLTSYTIWANNTGGSASFVLNLTVVEPTPGLVYNPVNLTLTRGVGMSPLAPSTYNGVAETWSIHPTLPSGLMFNNGLITGTPNVNLTTTMFTVWANNTQGQASFSLNLTVVEPIVSLSYLPQNVTLYRGIASSTVSPTYSGGAVQTWSIHPSLPAGLSFNNGVISGTPSVNQTTTAYTVWANNTGGSTSATLNLTILEPTVVLSYSAYDITLIRNDTTLNLQPSVSWGTPTSWSISPALPTGLSFSQGALSGTALVNMTRTMFTVWANNSGGSTAVYLNFTVVEPVVTLTFNPAEVVLVRNASMNPITAGFNGGAVDTWSIHPALPEGLQFVNGVLSGSALDNDSRTMYTVWANNSGGASSVMFNLTVTEPMLDFTYSPGAVEAMRGDPLTPFGATLNNDAAVASWGISPSLPEGLTFAAGWISGTPGVNSTATVYTVWANNSGGASTSQFTLTVLEPVAVVTYEPANFTVTRDAGAVLAVPVLAGGSVALWTIEPVLPAGLSFDNGTVSGVPTTSFPTTMFTVNATNSGGFALAFLNITSVEPLAELASIDDLVLVRLGERANASINNSGGAVASWAIEPALPSGVRFINGQVYGIARVNLTSTPYTVWANNSGGSVSTTFNLTVLEPPAAITYLQTDVALVAGKSTVRLAPVVTGGVPGSWAIEPALPEGMTFVNGIISGTPDVNREPTVYTVWANTTGGSASTTLTLSVDLPVYFARYPVSRFVLDVNETLLPQYPAASFDAIQRPVWTISPALPEGMNFSNGVVWGTPLNASKETTYLVNVTGDMVPLSLTFTLEVLDTAPVEVPDLTNGTLEEEVFIVPERRDFDTSFGMYYICPPILFSIVIIGAMAINNYLKRTGYIEVETEKNESEEDPSA